MPLWFFFFLLQLKGHTDTVTGLQLSPDGCDFFLVSYSIVDVLKVCLCVFVCVCVCVCAENTCACTNEGLSNAMQNMED